LIRVEKWGFELMQKIKITRKYFKMKQEDLVDENLTRGLISTLLASLCSNNIIKKIKILYH